ncbi:hypothetical protein ACO22_01329 [Paracoccidioides brasiliensis]|uniref:Uncharacterized protein n=1 Tax=Paracoccidioides brasiliensis TaxID=121759 RepID=A0A1D2JLY2_PARBR|nr:hypothetical protein ACO22_01329 [Paracoccidioides brasiliensis]ODH52339.1 hypothetical protein GX48_01402 [Paracoccidioides brasiliensis]
MSVRIHLDRPHAHFTNLDFITGKVILLLTTDTPITSIVVKLEGESRTRLAAPKYPHNDRNEKKRTEVESHKLLYKVLTLFPMESATDLAGGNNIYYTLPPGHHEYPFQFKFPFNNDCSKHMSTNLNMGGLRLEVARDTNKHVRKALPPSLTGFPGEAEIRYYVKATVGRPQFYKENYRGYADIKFLPIEPPRQTDTGVESYARRQQQFSKVSSIPEKKGLFQKSNPPSLIDLDEEPPKFSVDARLPSPPIITCNEPFPLRILVKKLNESSETIFLQMIQVELIAYTHIRAHDLTRSESGSWVIISLSNMNIPLIDGNVPAGKEWKVDSSLWDRIPLPSSVAPSFDTCNISRTYDLDVRVGLTHGLSGAMKPELVVLPLRMAVQVYSGIAPPKALLEAIRRSPRKDSNVSEVPPAQLPRPQAAPTFPPAAQEDFGDAPPSYEDAMAEALGPVDGPRREYNPPDTGSWPTTDQKGSANSKDDDRLFPNSGFMNASMESFFDTHSTTPVDGHISNCNLVDQPVSSPSSTGQAQQNQLFENSQNSQSQPVQEQSQRRPRPFMGVPSRKPVPGSKKHA